MNTMQKKEPILKNKKLLVYILGFGIIMLMVGSVLSLWVFKEEQNTETTTYEYNGYKFVDSNNGYIININNKNIAFNYLPNELEDIEAEGFNFVNNKYYILFDPAELNEGSYEVTKIKAILNYFSILGVPACVKDEGCSNIPIKDCSADAIYLKKESDKIYNQDKCIVLSYDNSGKIIDLFFYKALGVVK